MTKLDIALVPELATSVGIHGSTRQKEVGGPVCLGVLVGIFVWVTGRENGPPEKKEKEVEDG